MSDLIDRQAAIEALAEDMPSAYTPDGSHPADEGIFMAQEIYADCIQTLKEFPSAQPYEIHSDGRLWVTVDDIDKVNAVVVDENKSKFCKQFYQDANPEPCEDAVNRETILKFFDGWMSALDENCHNQSVSDLKIIKRDFANLPSVTPKQRTGEWIKLDMHRGMADHKCSVCKQECYVPTCMGEPMYAFCPNCGSYNGGEQDE